MKTILKRTIDMLWEQTLMWLLLVQVHSEAGGAQRGKGEPGGRGEISDAAVQWEREHARLRGQQQPSFCDPGAEPELRGRGGQQHPAAQRRGTSRPTTKWVPCALQVGGISLMFTLGRFFFAGWEYFWGVAFCWQWAATQRSSERLSRLLIPQ